MTNTDTHAPKFNVVDCPLTVNSATNNQLPHILVTIGDKTIHSLLDTGSSANIINSNLFDQLSLNNGHPTSIPSLGTERISEIINTQQQRIQELEKKIFLNKSNCSIYYKLILCLYFFF